MEGRAEADAWLVGILVTKGVSQCWRRRLIVIKLSLLIACGRAVRVPSSHVPRSSVLATVNSAIDKPHRAVERDREGEMARYG